MGSPRTTTTSNNTSQNSAWAPTQPYLQSGVQGLGDWMTGQGATSYQGPRVADISQQTQAGVDNLVQSAGANRANAYYNDVLNGDWLNQGNPYMDRLQDSVRASVMPSINSTFSGNGLFGSTAHQGTMERELSRGMAEPLFNAYENERNRQHSAAGALPGVDQMISGNYLQAGNVLDQHAQALVNAQQQQFEDDRLAPVRGITQAMPTINGVGGQYGTQTSSGTNTNQTRTPLGQQLLGAGLMGASVLAAPYTGGASLGGLGAGASMMGGGGGGQQSVGGMIGNGMGNMAQGAPWSYGNSWTPWVQRA
jgi:hypothetical protein